MFKFKSAWEKSFLNLCASETKFPTLNCWFLAKGYIFLRNTRLSRIGKQYANMLEKYDTWSQVLDPTFEVSATDVCCSIERVADTLVKRLPREKAQVSPGHSTAVEF